MNILIADDDAVFLELLGQLVAGFGHKVIPVGDGEEAWGHLLAHGADVVISDWQMPGLNGLELCERVRTCPEIAYPYFILLTARGDRHDVLTALRAGVDGHMAKPLDLDELEGCLIVAARVRSLHLKILRTQAALQATARCDALTGLGNRLSMREDLLRIHGRFVREGHRYNIALLDVDHFKEYNDTHGHQGGDALLAEVGRVLSAGIREGDFAYRYGGEEFLLVLPNRTIEEAARGAERCRRSVADIAPGTSVPGVATLSGGVSAAMEGESIEGVIGRADRALYRAKFAGRNRLVVDAGPAQLTASAEATPPALRRPFAGISTPPIG